MGCDEKDGIPELDDRWREKLQRNQLISSSFVSSWSNPRSSWCVVDDVAVNFHRRKYRGVYLIVQTVRKYQISTSDVYDVVGAAAPTHLDGSMAGDYGTCR